MLEREYLKAAVAAGGSKAHPTAQQLQMLANMDDDEEEEGAGGGEGADEEDDDMILAGGANQAGEQEDSGDSSSKNNGAKPIEIKRWLQWYLALEDHDFLVEVEREFISDKFNLIKMRDSCGNPPPMSKRRFKESLRLILSRKVPSEEDLQNPQYLELNQDAFDLYGRVH
jgi:hypothetical protein